MGKVLNITSKNNLLVKANELQILANKLSNNVAGVKLTLSSVQNYDKEIDIVSTANSLLKGFVDISNNIEVTSLNIKNYINDVMNFDKFDLDVDNMIQNNIDNLDN